jgi:acyl-homoserine lactone acylase PvdQ
MDISEALLTIAQIALGLAGFSAVLVALSGEPSRWTPLDSFRITGMLALSFGALFLSLIPFVLGSFSVSESTIWRISAGVTGFFMFGAGTMAHRRFRRLSPPDRAALNPKLAYANQVALSSLGLLAVASAAGLVGASAGVFFLGLVALLAFAAYMVVRFLIVRPSA